MIRSLLLTSMLSFASTMGASIKKDAPLKSEETKITRTTPTAENPNYEMSWDYPFVQQVNQPWKFNRDNATLWPITTSGDKYNYYTFNQKNYNFTRNSVWSIDSTFYTQNTVMEYRYTNTGYRFGSLKIPFNNANNDYPYDTESNVNLCIYKFVPHNQAVSTNFTLNTTLTPLIDIFNRSNAWYENVAVDVRIQFRIKILTTRNQIVENYNNASITESTNFFNWYNNITSTATDITAETIYRDIKVAKINTDGTVTNLGNQETTLTTNLSNLGLLSTETNYAVMLIEKGICFYAADTNNRITANDYSIQIKDRWGTTDGNRYNYYWMHNTESSITGTYILGTNLEVIDLPGLMFTVLGMPFTFYSTAFNLTIFPGTPYSINIGSILLTILASLIFIFIVRLILKVFS